MEHGAHNSLHYGTSTVCGKAESCKTPGRTLMGTVSTTIAGGQNSMSHHGAIFVSDDICSKCSAAQSQVSGTNTGQGRAGQGRAGQNVAAGDTNLKISTN